MDNIQGKIQEFLQNPDALSQIQGVMASLGMGEESSSNIDIASMLGGLQSGDNNDGAVGNQMFGGDGGINLWSIAELLPMLTSLKNGDGSYSTGLLMGVRPFLSQHRQRRVTEAVQLMKVLDLLPILKESGLLSNLLGGDSGNGS